MQNKHKHASRGLSLLLALVLLLSTGCGAQKDTETPPAEDEAPAVETEQTVTPEPQPEPEAEPEAESGPKVYTDLQEALDDMVEKYGAVGMELAVVKGGELYGAYSSGWAVKDVTPISNENLMLAGSISKVVTGIATLLAYEDGLVDLDADISEYWGVEIVNPHYPDIPITLRMLLNHTSSMATTDADYSRKYEDTKAYLAAPTSWMDLVPGAPASFVYSNYGYDLLGMTVELASGKYIDDILQERLFDAMDISAGFFSDNLDKSLLMANYGVSDMVSMTAGTHANAVRGDFPGYNGINYCGRFKTSAETLAKLIVLLTNDGVYNGQQLMSPESVALLENPLFQPGSTYYQCEVSQRYRESFYDRDGVFYHTGDIYGNYTCFAYQPSTGDGVVILTTGATNLIKDERTKLSGCYSEITGIAFDYLLTLPDNEPSADQNEADTQPVSPLDGIWVKKGFAGGVSTISEFIFSGNTYTRAAKGGGTGGDYETGMFTLENDVLKFSGKRHSISSGNYSTKDLQYDSPLTILSENEIQLKFGNYTRSDTITCAEDLRAQMEEKGAEFGYDAGESSAGSADYAYVAGSVFRDIRREYSEATAQCAYVYAYTDLNGDLCVLTDVRYKIISNYSEVTLHNMTKGTKITDPADYYEKQADRAYGSNKLQYLNLASEVNGHHYKMLSALSSILNGGANTYGGVYVDADTLNQ